MRTSAQQKQYEAVREEIALIIQKVVDNAIHLPIRSHREYEYTDHILSLPGLGIIDEDQGVQDYALKEAGFKRLIPKV